MLVKEEELELIMQVVLALMVAMVELLLMELQGQEEITQVYLQPTQ